jgi:hypothetical protein
MVSIVSCNLKKKSARALSKQDDITTSGIKLPWKLFNFIPLSRIREKGSQYLQSIISHIKIILFLSKYPKGKDD